MIAAPRSSLTLRPQGGFGLVELLVGMIIGLLAVAASVQAWSALSVSQSELSRQIELHTQVRQLVSTMATQFQMGASLGLRNTSGSVTLTGISGNALQVDATSVAVQYAIPLGADNIGCLWRASSGLNGVSHNRYAFDATEATLRCQANQTLTQPLIDGLRQIQWQLAIASSAGVRWKSVALVEDADLARAVAVRVCVHVQGGASPLAPATVISCDGSTAASNGLQQIVHSRTMALTALQP